jgi:hypothetical protein
VSLAEEMSVPEEGLSCMELVCFCSELTWDNAEVGFVGEGGGGKQIHWRKCVVSTCSTNKDMENYTKYTKYIVYSVQYTLYGVRYTVYKV